MANSWLDDEDFRINLSKSFIHGEITTTNVLYNWQKNEISLVDFEKSRIDTPFIDVGAFCAELKLTFALDAHNEFRAEPYIGFFLREYYRYRTNLDLPYRQFTWIQSFFMGLHLLDIAQGKWLDDSLKNWCIRSAQILWELKLIKNDVFSFPFLEKKVVLFDFYNTLVKIKDEEGDSKNFEKVLSIISEETGSNIGSLKINALWLREKYFEEIGKEYLVSHERFPDIDLEIIWGIILQSPELEIPKEKLFNNSVSLPQKILKGFRKSAIRYFETVQNVVNVMKYLTQRGIKVGIVTNAQKIYFEEEIQLTGILPYVDCIIISAEYHFQKPDVRLFELALERIGFSAEKAVFVGDDMLSDIQGAKKAGIHTVYIPSDFGANFSLDISPDDVIRDVQNLPELFGATKEIYPFIAAPRAPDR